MKAIVLRGTSLTCSRFIFGTADLFNVGTKRQRLNLLDAAIANGFTHFDTAPYYGFGTAERDLFHVLKANPNVSVTTKVGIYSPGGEEQSFAPVFLRKAIGRLVPTISRPIISFDLGRARSALEGSLRRLGREHVDIYMLHEPKIGLLNTDEWRYWLESLIKAGTIGNFGLAIGADRIEAFLDNAPWMTNLVQVFDSLDKREADILPRHGKPLQITYGYVSAALSRNDTRRVTQILKQALNRNCDGAIIVSTKRVERLSQYSQLADTERD